MSIRPTSQSKFIPKKPVRKVSGRKIVATTVSQYIVSFMRRSISCAIESAAASIPSTSRLSWLVDPFEVALVVGDQVLDLADLLADPLEDPALRAELAPHRRQPQADRPQRPHPHPGAAGLGGRGLEPLERQLGVAERVEGGGDHRVEDGVDDVLLAAALGVVGGQQRGQRDALAVGGEEEVAVDEDVDLDRPQRRGVVAPRRSSST